MSLCGLAHCAYRLDRIAFLKGASSIAFTVRNLHTQESHGNRTSHVLLLGYRTPRTAHSLLMAGFWVLAALIVTGRYGWGAGGGFGVFHQSCPCLNTPISPGSGGRPLGSLGELKAGVCRILGGLMCKCLEKAFRHWGWGEVKEGGEGGRIAISGESTGTHSCAPPGLQNPLCWGMLEALRGLFQVLHRSLDLWMLLASNTATVETLKVRRLATESSLPFTEKVTQDCLSGLPFPYL